MNSNPRFPLYIPTKGRHEYLLTSRHLTKMGLRHFLVVEPAEVASYQAAVKAANVSADVLTLDLSFKDRYELCDDQGRERTGSGPARNFAWEHARASGAKRHWVMDDNIGGFVRMNQNRRVPCVSPAFFAAQEDFVERYANIAMSGPNYRFFADARTRRPPFQLNTRIYSCNLILTECGFRWRGRYNEDTILSLDLLKAGWCTVLFNAFLQNKLSTQTMKGGNTSELYQGETRTHGERYARNGTTAKSEMLARVHPDVARVAWRYGRVHHHVDYRPFQDRRLIRRPDVEVQSGVDNYGMTLIQTR